MHYRMFVTFNKLEAEDSEEARSDVFRKLSEDGSLFGGRFHSGYADWLVIGGRWSGALSRATWAKDIQAQIDALEKKHKMQVWGAYYGDAQKREEQERLRKEIEALYAEAIPKPLREKGLLYVRDTYSTYGYEDDAMVVTEELYDAHLVNYEGEHIVTDDVISFVDLDYDPVARGFIGKKWLVVVDAHM